MSVDANTLISDDKLRGVGVAPHRHAPQRASGKPAADLLGRLPGLLAVLDWGTVAAGGYLACKWMQGQDPEATNNALEVLFAATLTVNFLFFAHAYTVRSITHHAAQLVKVSVAWAAAIGLIAGVNYLRGAGQDSVAPAALLWYVATWLLLLGTRFATTWQLATWRQQGRLIRRVAILGSKDSALELAARIKRSTDTVMVGLFLNEEGTEGSEAASGNTDDLVALAASGKVDEVIFSSPWSSPRSLNDAIAKFSVLQTELKIDSGMSSLNVRPRDFSVVAGIPTLTLQHRPLAGWGAPVKRAEDILFSSLLLLLTAPLLLAIAVLIKLETRGPVIFRQERYGFNNNRITVFKFRSMYHRDTPEEDTPQATRNDARITRVGAILRRTSLDELPQLVNVLLGDMSMVGPRPHATAHNEKYAKLIDLYLSRHRMKPGITGWAQVNGARGETENCEQMQRRLEYDLSYIAYWSLLLDLKVMLTTIPVVLRGTNAY